MLPNSTKVLSVKDNVTIIVSHINIRSIARRCHSIHNMVWFSITVRTTNNYGYSYCLPLNYTYHSQICSWREKHLGLASTIIKNAVSDQFNCVISD